MRKPLPWAFRSTTKIKIKSLFLVNLIPSILVAGHGYLGQEVARQALTLNWKVTTLSRSPGEADHACDLTDLTALESLQTEGLQPTHIVACASSGRGDLEAYRSIFCEGTRHLQQVFPQAAFTFISSTSVYRQLDGSIVDEESDFAGETQKSLILREAENLVLSEHGTVLRLSGIYGPERSVILSRFLAGKATLEKTAEGIGVRILNQIHRDDAAEAIVHLIKEGFAGLYNVSDNQPISQLQTYEALCKLLDQPLPPTAPPNPNSKRGWTNKAVSNARLQATGWAPRHANFLSSVSELIPTLKQ